MTAYHYQCASCFCTLHRDSLKPGESYVFATTGDICWSCDDSRRREAEQLRIEEEENDDDDY
jgi:Zn-finger protein